MIYLKLFEQYKSILESSENREDCIRKYGKHLFGDQFIQGFNKSDEVNTNLENELIKLIRDFTGNDFGKRLDPAFATKMKELSKCLDVYPSVLKQIKAPVFRGTKIKFRDIIKYKIEKPSSKRVIGTYDNNDKEMAFISNFIYKPTSIVSSWTTDWKKACQFSDRGGTELTNPINMIFKDYIFGSPGMLDADADHYEPVLIDESKIPESLLNSVIPAVLVCNKLDGFLFNSNEMDKLSSSGHCEEFETLKINNDPIEVKVMFYTFYNQKYKKFVIINSSR
jgi:hypothetical protein